MSAIAGAAHATWPARGQAMASDAWGPLLLGALAAALVASRLELLAALVLFGGFAGWKLEAPMPRASWLRMLLVAVVIAVLANLYLAGGQPLPLPRLFGAHASREGLSLGIVMALRLVAAALLMRALAARWPGERAAEELGGRLSPLARIGWPVDQWRAVLGLALRFVPLIRTEAQRIGALQSLRAGHAAKSPAERLTRLRAAMVPTLVASLERAEQVSLALEARHHRLRPARLTRWPRAAVLGGVALFAASCLWRS